MNFFNFIFFFFFFILSFYLGEYFKDGALCVGEGVC